MGYGDTWDTQGTRIHRIWGHMRYKDEQLGYRDTWDTQGTKDIQDTGISYADYTQGDTWDTGIHVCLCA